MAQSAAIRRLKKEYANLRKDPTPGADVRPLETNFLHAHFLLHGEVFHDTPYEGGVFHGVLKFPSNYPLKPPTVMMRTPSGRFQPDKKICFSMSDFHPELWNPMWSIRSILTGLISFMNSDELTTGGIRESSANRTSLAKESLKYCMNKDALALELFKDELELFEKERDDLGSAWPPERKVPATKEVPKVDDTPIRRRRIIRNTTRLNARKSQDSKTSSTTEENQEESGTRETSANSGNGKNAAKNKKKRRKEKLKKLSKKFETTLSEQVPKFLAAVETRLSENNLDVSQHHADHVCWRTEAMEEYTDLVDALRGAEGWTILIESEIGGRPIATFRLEQGIRCGDRLLDVVEIPSPKEGSAYKSGLEHVEYVLKCGDEKKPISPRNDETHQTVLDSFMTEFPNFQWNTKAKDKELNPDVATKIELSGFGVCGIKFHLMPLSEVIEYEINEMKVKTL